MDLKTLSIVKTHPRDLWSQVIKLALGCQLLLPWDNAFNKFTAAAASAENCTLTALRRFSAVYSSLLESFLFSRRQLRRKGSAGLVVSGRDHKSGDPCSLAPVVLTG